MIFEHQQYQEDCVKRILAALAGIDFSFERKDKIRLLRENLAKIAKENNYPDFKSCDKWGIDVQMETGTGKTFTYLNTIYELHEKIGQKKFIIVLPRTAIKLGVIQNIKLTKEYFYKMYNKKHFKKHLNIINYPQDGLKKTETKFIKSDDLSILITTNSAFNSDTNNINKPVDTLFCGSIWDGIAKQSPVVIIDEPHLLVGKKTEKGLDKLTDSLFIRFGATFPTNEKHQLSNVAYALDSISSFSQHLVKGIKVYTVFDNSEQGAVHVHNIKPDRCFDIHYNINKQLHKATVRMHNDVGSITKLSKFKNHVVTKITRNKISFLGGGSLDAYNGNYDLSENELRDMIKNTITLHFKNEQRYFEKNIKTLSLFFIPSIGDFRYNHPLAKKNEGRPRIIDIFEKEYRAQWEGVLRNTDNAMYKEFLSKDYKGDKLQVHDGYFSDDYQGTKDEKETKGVDAILNKKEELLSLDINSPVRSLRFIFSVWALQEGWDNPNIFNICKLSSTPKEISRRQQVGRGLRIAVNQQGKRLTYENDAEFYDINTLNMVVSGQEQHFIYAIQNEIAGASHSFVDGIIDINAMSNLMHLGIKTNELMQLLNFLETKGIVKANEQGDYEIHSPIAVYMQAHPDHFSFLGDRFQKIKDAFNPNFDVVKNGNEKRPEVKVRKPQWKQFKELWETINKKSKIVYKDIKEEEILKRVAREFNNTDIWEVKNRITEEKYDAQKNQVERISDNPVESPRYFFENSMSDYAVKFAKDAEYPIPFILKLFDKLDIKKIKINPSYSEKVLLTVLKDVIHQTILCNVSYSFCQTDIYPNMLQDGNGKLIEILKEEVVASLGKQDLKGCSPAEFLYDTVMYDSEIEKHSIVDSFSKFNKKEIVVFAKLPPIKIPTPYKTYTPDFAYLIKTDSGKQLFLVVETKGYKFERNMSEEEEYKIKYAEKFFVALQEELPHINIQYKTRIIGQDLAIILQELKV